MFSATMSAQFDAHFVSETLGFFVYWVFWVLLRFPGWGKQNIINQIHPRYESLFLLLIELILLLPLLLLLLFHLCCIAPVHN